MQALHCRHFISNAQIPLSIAAVKGLLMGVEQTLINTAMQEKANHNVGMFACCL